MEMDIFFVLVLMIFLILQVYLLHPIKKSFLSSSLRLTFCERVFATQAV
jgi:hypothetical protein